MIIDGQIVPRHDHGAYIRGWCECLDGLDRGYLIRHNPYSRHYFFNHHYSWEAGRDDAYAFFLDSCDFVYEFEV